MHGRPGPSGRSLTINSSGARASALRTSKVTIASSGGASSANSHVPLDCFGGELDGRRDRASPGPGRTERQVVRLGRGRRHDCQRHRSAPTAGRNPARAAFPACCSIARKTPRILRPSPGTVDLHEIDARRGKGQRFRSRQARGPRRTGRARNASVPVSDQPLIFGAAAFWSSKKSRSCISLLRFRSSRKRRRIGRRRACRPRPSWLRRRRTPATTAGPCAASGSSARRLKSSQTEKGVASSRNSCAATRPIQRERAAASRHEEKRRMGSETRRLR